MCGQPVSCLRRIRAAGCLERSPTSRGNATNFYGQPIEGVVVLVDMNDRQSRGGSRQRCPAAAAAEPGARRKVYGRRATAPKPLVITQPDGASFEIKGQEVRWQKWRFRYAMHPREGLVLHTVAYDDQGRVRSILYRGSLSEMVGAVRRHRRQLAVAQRLRRRRVQRRTTGQLDRAEDRRARERDADRRDVCGRRRRAVRAAARGRHLRA